ncbi:ABC transporter ATP-binding protein/permease [Bacteroidia bacterium]|nr:ABC transporter ATP-binding protein/permease [Bacteroidia bacterium]
MAGRKDRDIPKAKINKENLKEALRIFRYLKPYKRYFIGGLVFISLSAFSTMAFPFLIGKMVDIAGKGIAEANNLPKVGGFDLKAVQFPSSWTLNTVLVLIFVQLSFQFLFSYMRLYLLSNAGIKSTRDLRVELYSKLIRMPMDFFNTQRVGDLTSRLAADAGQIQDTVSTVLAEFLRGILTLAIGIGMIFYISNQLALVMLSVVPLLALTAFFFGTKIRNLAKKETDMLADTGNILQESLSGAAVVKAFTNEELETQRYKGSMGQLVNFAIKNAIFRGLFVSSMIFLVFGVIGFVVWYAGGMITAGELSLGDLIQFVVYSTFVGGTFAGFANMFGQLQKTLGSTQRVRELLDMETEFDVHSKGNSTINDYKLEFRNVQFHYPSRKDVQVLKDVSFSVNEGEQLAIVGSSGSGKSTIASLAMRFYDPVEGSIVFGGTPTTEFDLETYRDLFAYVPQEVMLFATTIYENILYGNPDANMEEVKEAADRANALEFVEKFPDGFETLVGERGVQLSGGQRQRIAIARALLKNPKFLILDEATSSLDNESELLVQEALEELMKGRTSIVIAHRLSTIRNADKIIVLNEGEIVEEGNHQTLVNKSQGYYKKLLETSSLLGGS